MAADRATSPARPSNGQRLIFLHGFTQTHHHWHAVADSVLRRLGCLHTLVFVDLPGHGLSSDDRTSIDDASALVSAAGGGTYIGYSMGARWALAAAADHPTQIERLVLVGASPGIDDATERAARAEQDRALAQRIVDIGVTRFVDEWLAMPIFANLSADAAQRRHRVANTADGLASSLMRAGAGVQRSVWEALPTITVPTLLLVGDADAKFTAIAERMAARLPNSTSVTIPGAGHAAHAEQPAATAAAIAEWLTRVPGPV